MRSAPWLWLSVAASMTGCRTPDAPAPRSTPRAHEVTAACAALHDASPQLWGERLPPVMAAGRAAEAPLLALLEQRPAAAGAQATVAALGRIGGTATVRACRQIVDERGALAIEAALALGLLPTGPEDPALLACVGDRYTDATLRTAAACSLARHGERTLAPEWLAAVVRAGTPAGLADERALGLPPKTRWARERYFVQRLLRDLGHVDLSTALDTDASWPSLEQLAPRVRSRLATSSARPVAR
ncbi:MAG: hypothetical protein ACON4Z_07770 [Planctomycetota bacterium]